MHNPTPFRTARAVLVATLLLALVAVPGAAWAAPAWADDAGAPVWSRWQRLTDTVHGWLVDLGSGLGAFVAASNGGQGGGSAPGDPTDQAGIIADPDGLTSQGGVFGDPDGATDQAGLIGDPDGATDQAGLIGDPNG